MAYETANRGSLFKNKRKEEEKHPDYNGSLNVNGTDYWISAWLQTSQKTGEKFMSLSIKPKQEQQAPAKKPTKDEGLNDLDDDIPFN